jgi:hypothetical protein
MLTTEGLRRVYISTRTWSSFETIVTSEVAVVGLASTTSATGVGWVEMACGAVIPHARLTKEKNINIDRTVREFRESLGMLDDPFIIVDD